MIALLFKVQLKFPSVFLSFPSVSAVCVCMCGGGLSLSSSTLYQMPISLKQMENQERLTGFSH